ncbi:MAG: hypothetical protein J0M26_20325 [Planctomycetes bacterium]|nr:hypothetical protein [Planctomycetota bacterium]
MQILRFIATLLIASILSPLSVAQDYPKLFENEPVHFTSGAFEGFRGQAIELRIGKESHTIDDVPVGEEIVGVLSRDDCRAYMRSAGVISEVGDTFRVTLQTIDLKSIGVETRPTQSSLRILVKIKSDNGSGEALLAQSEEVDLQNFVAINIPGNKVRGNSEELLATLYVSNARNEVLRCDIISTATK